MMASDLIKAFLVSATTLSTYGDGVGCRLKKLFHNHSHLTAQLAFLGQLPASFQSALVISSWPPICWHSSFLVKWLSR